MIRRLRHHSRLLALAACGGLACAVLAGCVDRRFIITTEPPTAVVLVNGKPAGQSPVDRQWLYNGTYQFTLIKDGYETTVVNQPVPPKWYEYVPLDFFSENVWPFMIRDVRTFKYTMRPLQIVPPEVVRDAAENLRKKGQSIGTAPLPPGTVPPGPPQVLPPGTVPPGTPQVLPPGTVPPGTPQVLPAPTPVPGQQPGVLPPVGPGPPPPVPPALR